MKRTATLFVLFFSLLPVAVLAEEGWERKNRASLVMEYGIDSLERRYYHPSFRFDFPFRGGAWFSEVQYHARMNGRLQGAIDYWVNVGVQKTFREKWSLELRLNHFCRHETLRDTPYIWNLNEVLAKAGLAGGNFDLALGIGGFTGGSEGYRQLAVAGGEWRGFLIPELALAAELKWVNFARLFHEWGISLALNKNIDLFFKNVRHYEFPPSSYLGLRYKSAPEHEAALESMRVRVGASPFDDVFKLEVAGNFKFEFFSKPMRRVVAGIDFESPILNGDGFFAQFWPGKMIYDINLDYEKKIGPGLFAAWTSHYRLDLPVDDELPFTASLFSGLALRNQPNFDELERAVRFEVAAGYDFKRGLEGCGKAGVLLCRNELLMLLAEAQGRVDAKRIKVDFRVLANFGRPVQLRPYIGWKKDFFLDDAPAIPGKLLFGLGFFKKF